MLAYQRTSPRTAAHNRQVNKNKPQQKPLQQAISGSLVPNTPPSQISIDTSAITFPWEQPSSPSTKASMLENRRHRLKSIMQEHAQEGDSVQLKRIAMEWNALTEARDSMTREQFNRELKLEHCEKVLNLRRTLETLVGDTTFEADQGIKLGMYELLSRIRSHCQTHTITNEVCMNLKRQCELWKTAMHDASAPPPPVPPPPPLPFAASALKLPTAKPRIVKNVQSKGVSFRTPLKQMNTDILAAISTKGRSSLKQTPYKLSPGGTPHRSRTETCDPITNALRTKFKNVHVMSPMAFGSPLVDCPMVDSPVIESTCSTPYAEPLFFAMDKSQPLPKMII